MLLCEPEIPDKYWVNCFTFMCRNCDTNFDIVFPNDNYIVKFEEVGGGEVKWLPSYGRGGYIELITKLIPEHTSDDEITMAKASTFIRELNKCCEKGTSGNGYDFCRTKFECPNCNSRDLTTIEEKVLTNPKLSWLKISY